jgi:hypothetical protein
MSIEMLTLRHPLTANYGVEVSNERGPALARREGPSSVGRRKADALDQRAVAWVGVKEVIGRVGLDV